jgi:hypothetical protein
MISPSVEQIRERLEQWHASCRIDADARINSGDSEQIEIALNQALSEDDYTPDAVLLFSRAPADIAYLLTLLDTRSREVERLREDLRRRDETITLLMGRIEDQKEGPGSKASQGDKGWNDWTGLL